MTTAGARIGFAAAAAAVTAGSVLLAAPSASADTAPVCGPAVPISSANNAGHAVALTVPQYSGSGPLTGVAITIVPTTHYQNTFLNLSTFGVGAGSADQAYSGAAAVLQATGPGLAAFHDFKLRLPGTNSASDPGNPGPGSAFSGGPGSFTTGTPQPTLPTDLAAAEAVGGAGTSTAAAAPADWAALGYSFTPDATVPASASGDLSYATTSAGNVSAAALPSYAGTGSVSLSAIDDSLLSTSADSTSGQWAAGSTDSGTVQACATYTTDSGPDAALPEAPRALLLPLSAFAIGAGALVLRKRRSTS